jgi:DMSO/TMAO reductase YedYZ molybdopterin-dependent catalytic subunit
MTSRRLLSRRDVFRIGAALGLAACDTGKPREGVLGLVERWNGGVQSRLLSSARQGRVGDVTPESAFPIYHIAPKVPIAPPGWKLKIGGRVARPMELTLDDLMKLPRTVERIEHHCVEGWSAIAEWTGVRLSEIAKQVGAEDVAYVEFKSFDNDYWSSWDRDSAMHDQTLLAYGMNGRPLTPDHGAPARLYGAVKLGYKQVKYLTEVNFLDHETAGYWEVRGYEWFAGT